MTFEVTLRDGRGHEYLVKVDAWHKAYAPDEARRVAVAEHGAKMPLSLRRVTAK